MKRSSFKPAQELEPPCPEPPVHLSERAAAMWRELGQSRAKTTGRRALFQAALEAMDRCEAARAAIAIEGMTSTTPGTGAQHVHPLVKVELESRRQFASLCATRPGFSASHWLVTVRALTQRTERGTP